jgi:hypothetical protein
MTTNRQLNKLLDNLGHDSVVDALRHAEKMRSVLRAINIWAQHDLLDNEHVAGVTEAALETKPQETK